MPVNRTQAKKLLNASELALFDVGRPGGAKDLSAAQLRRKVERTQRLRDKYRDQYKRQRLASRAATGSRGGRSGVANQRSKQKGMLFDELLKRLKAQLAKAEKAAPKKAAGKKAAGKKAAARKAPRRTSAAKRDMARRSASKRPAAKKAASKAAAPAVVKKTPRKAAKKRLPTDGGAGEPQVSPAAVPPAAGLFGVPGLSPKARVPMETPGLSNLERNRVGYVSKEAEAIANERHFDEARGQAIHGHAGTANRHQQGKRDNRGG